MKKNIFIRIAALLSGAAICVSGSAALPAAAVDDSSGSGIYSLGDVNGDKLVNASDASEMLVYYSVMSTNTGAVSWTEEKRAAGDIDHNGLVDARDASYVLQYYAYRSTTTSYYPLSMYEYMSDLFRVDFEYPEEGFDFRARQDYNIETRTLTLHWDKAYCADHTEATGYKVKVFRPGSYYNDYEEIVFMDEFVHENYAVVQLPIDIMANDENYYYTVIPYAEKNGYITYFYNLYDKLRREVAIINNAKLTPHDTYPLYNIKGDKPYKSGNYTVTAADKKIMDKFAAEHFTEDMTNYDKLEYTWRWLWENVTYADGSQGWNTYDKIAGCSWVQACFEKKLGQCLQYNGALAEMLAYMGYDVYMMEMWMDKPNKAIQHFRAEITIDGQAYGIEVGNKGNTGSWTWFMEPIESSIIF